MLKTSPIITSACASPTTNFRHAPTPSSQGSPHPRRPSSAAARASPFGKSRATSTQGSDGRSPAIPPTALPRPSSAEATPDEPPTPPHPQPMNPSSDPPPAVANAATTEPGLSSPMKRRASSDTGAPQTEGSNPPGPVDTPEEESSASKRRRPEQPPTKVLPQEYVQCPTPDMVELIAHMINELIATNDAIRISNGTLTRFHSRTAPGISVRDYLHRLARHATLTPPLLLAMVYYIDRLCAMYQEFTINTLTVHRFLITAATVAAKGLSDAFWNNTTYARVGGVRLAELNMLELDFLKRVDWKIVPNPEVLVAYYRGLVERTPGYGFESAESEGVDDDDDDAEEGDASEGIDEQ